ncbi:MAG TPA: AI-2E family transporter [Halobacteriales archaeon]|nr:AI-2E family transporter [Halobacteriales archaeon]
MNGNGDETPDQAPGGLDLAATLHSVGLDRKRLVLWAITGVILLGMWIFAWQFVGTLIVGLFVYYVCRPLFGRIHSRIHNRTLAVAVTLVTVAIPTLLLIGWTVAILVQAIAGFLGSEAGDQIQAIIEPYVDVSAELGSVDQVVRQVVEDPQGFTEQVGPLVSGLTEGLLAALATLGSVGLQAFIVLVITFYLLRDDVRIAAWARRTFVPEDGVVETYLVRLDRDLENIFFGNILNALATGLIAVVSYFLLNTIAPDVVTIPQATLVGVLVGVASLVPAIGIKLVTWPLGFYLLARAALLEPEAIWFPVVFFVVSFVVVDYIPDQLLRPYVSGRGLNVGAVMLAYLFGPILFGWYGIFLGPFLLAVVYDFGLVVVPWLTHSETEPPSIPDEEAEPDEAVVADEAEDEAAPPADGGPAGSGEPDRDPPGDVDRPGDGDGPTDT